jgi:hypothetical protein
MSRCSSKMGLRPALNFSSCFLYFSQKGLLLGWVDSRTDMDVVMKKKFSVGCNLSRKIPGLQHAFLVQSCRENSCHYRGFFNMELGYCRAEAIIGLCVAINICCTVESRTRRRRASERRHRSLCINAALSGFHVQLDTLYN